MGQQSRLCLAMQEEVLELSRIQLSAITWTVAPQASLSMEFSRQEY